MGSVAIPSTGKKNKTVPLYFYDSSPFIGVANNGTDYTVSSGGSRAYFVTNRIKGQLKIDFVYGDRVQLVKINTDGTSQNVSTGTFDVDDTVLGFTFKDAVTHIAQYKFNFTY